MTIDAIPLQCCSLFILIIGYLVLSFHLPKWAALFIAVVKAAVPFLYFGLVFEDRGWTLYDDVRYYEVGASLLDLGYRPWDLVFDPQGRDQLTSAAASRHTLYYFWNVLAQSIVGTYYFAAVYFNIGLTFLTGILMFRTLRLVGLPIRFLQCLLAFQLLHWDYLSWTSMLNVKETLVEALIVISLCSILRFASRGNWLSLFGVAGSFLLLFILRLYVPFLIMTAVGVWILLQWHDPRKYLLLPLVAAILILLYAKIGSYDQQLYPHMVLFGAFRFILTPQPWSITPAYSFLLVPTILQWIFVGPALIGMVQLWRKHQACRLLILVMLVFIAFYAVFPAHQGPRHRVQLVAMFSLVEMWFVAGLLAGPLGMDQRTRSPTRFRPSAEGHLGP